MYMCTHNIFTESSTRLSIIDLANEHSTHGISPVSFDFPVSLETGKKNTPATHNMVTHIYMYNNKLVRSVYLILPSFQMSLFTLITV